MSASTAKTTEMNIIRQVEHGGWCPIWLYCDDKLRWNGQNAVPRPTDVLNTGVSQYKPTYNQVTNANFDPEAMICVH